ncbi:MAG: hypothetical protein ACRD5Z_25605, partial [Bryobacteraceae bacterium]
RDRPSGDAPLNQVRHHEEIEEDESSCSPGGGAGFPDRTAPRARLTSRRSFSAPEFYCLIFVADFHIIRQLSSDAH